MRLYLSSVLYLNALLAVNCYNSL